jgi:adenine-specific DNA-methyltransferase
MPIERLRPTFSFDEERLKELKKIAPEAFADGKVNWEVLKEALGEHLEDESGDVEHFGLFWPGKKEARRIASIPSKGTLVPVFGEGLKADGTSDSNGVNDSHNIFIEGENLEVLKILQKSYAGRIKMIYIDPPYNTGNDFVYDDDYTESLDEYLRRTGQIDGEGKPLTTNRKADGRFHSKWLGMIYPRLILARNLLSEDGVIFISIDDNEVHNLRQILNEVFGEECIEQYVWDVREKGNMPKTARFTVRKEHEYILGAYRNSFNKNLSKYEEYKYKNKAEWSNPDNDPRGPWMSGNMSRGSDSASGGSKCYTITNPQGLQFYRDWSIDEETFKELLADNRIYFADNGRGVPRLKIFQNEPTLSIQSSIFDNLESSQTGKKQIQELLGDIEFDYPKPVKLIKRIIEIASDPDAIIMDFFVGSGTTLQAVVEMNLKDNGNRRFIGIQMAEKCLEESKAFQTGFKTISDIARARISKVLKQIENKATIPLGYRMFKLQSSNFLKWKDYRGDNNKILQAQFEEFVNSPLIANWSSEYLLYETMLIEGFPLDSRLEVSIVSGNRIIKATSSFCNHSLIICFDQKIKTETINYLKFEEGEIFICLDKAISDQDKIILSDKGVIKTI